MKTSFGELVSLLLSSAEFWAAIIGAVVGGIFATILQLIATWSARRERRAERLTLLRTTGYGVYWKMIHIHSDLHNISQHIENRFRAVPEALHGRPSQFVIELVSYPENIAFTTEEMALVVSLKDDDLINEMMNIPTQHRTIMDSIKKIDERRQKITDIIDNLPASEKQLDLEENMLTLSPSAETRIAPHTRTLDELIRSIRHLSLQYEASAKLTLENLHQRLKAELNVGGDLLFLFNPGKATMGKLE